MLLMLETAYSTDSILQDEPYFFRWSIREQYNIIKYRIDRRCTEIFIAKSMSSYLTSLIILNIRSAFSQGDTVLYRNKVLENMMHQSEVA